MKKIRKITLSRICIAICFCMVLSVAGCGNANGNGNENKNENKKEEEQKKSNQKEEEQKKEDNKQPEQQSPYPKKIELDKEQQYKINIFLSNFAEQSMKSYDHEKVTDAELLTFGFLGERINNTNKNQYIDSYEARSLENINRRLQRFLGKEVYPQEGQTFNSQSMGVSMQYKNGMILIPAADGDSHGEIAVVDEMYEEEQNRFSVKFKVYLIEKYSMGGMSVDDKNYYYTTPEQAAASNEMSCVASGTASVIPYRNGNIDSYHLLTYEIH